MTVSADRARFAAGVLRAAAAAGWLGTGDLLFEALTLAAWAEQGEEEGMPRGKTIRPEAVLKMALNGRRLAGEKWNGVWVLDCPDYPDIPEKFRGVADASGAVEDFIRRATAAGGDP